MSRTTKHARKGRALAQLRGPKARIAADHGSRVALAKNVAVTDDAGADVAPADSAALAEGEPLQPRAGARNAQDAPTEARLPLPRSQPRAGERKTKGGNRPRAVNDKKQGVVRTARYQIVWPGKEVDERWQHVSERCQEAANWFWRYWIVWQLNHDGEQKVRTYQREWVDWKEGKKEKRKALKKPKAIHAFDKQFCNDAYHAMAVRFPDLHSCTRGMLQRDIEKLIKSRPAAKGSWAAWQQILLCKEGMPSFTRQLPVPLKNEKAAMLILPPEGSKDYQVRIAVDRVESDDKSRGSCHQDVATLKTRKPNMRTHTVVIDRVASGEYKLCGSKLWWDDRKREWNFLLCYQMPVDKHPKPGHGKAILWPRGDHPWTLTHAGRHRWIGGKGVEVADVRRAIMQQRRSRRANYRNAGSSTKGHGRVRATAASRKLSQRWKQFVKRLSHTWSKRVVDYCVEAGIGTLTVIQPTEGFRDGLFLTNAGKDPGIRESSGWDWHQMVTLVNQKAEAVGISVHVQQRSGKRRRGLGTPPMERT